MEITPYWIRHYGYWGIFSSLLLGIVGVPIPDEWLLTLAGYLVYKGHLQFLPTLVSAFLGSVCGITLSYGLGRTAGSYVIGKYGHAVHLSAEKINQVHRWFNRTGGWALVFGYFVPGIRHLTALVAGISKLQFSLFAQYAYAGAFIWSATFISLGYLLGKGGARVAVELHRYLVAGAGVVVALGLAVLLYRWLQKEKI